MTATHILRILEDEQRQHDVRAHRDVFYLPYPERMKHLTLHIAKYAGRLAHPKSTPDQLARTIADTFVILLSASDVLRIDFPKALSRWTSADDHPDLLALSAALSAAEPHIKEIGDWYLRAVASAAGKMAKACESLDHMEPIPYREMLTEAVVELTRTTLIASAIISLDIEAAVRRRWQEIEAAGSL